MSGLSSRVMNMKFMKKEDSVDIEQEKVTRVKDQSEWKHPDADKIIRKAKSNVETVGYSSINMYGDQPVIRHKWGNHENTKVDLKEPEVENEAGDSSDVDLGFLKLKDGIKKGKKSKSDKNTSASSKGKEFLKGFLDSKKRANNAETSSGEYIPELPNKRKRLNNPASATSPSKDRMQSRHF